MNPSSSLAALSALSPLSPGSLGGGMSSFGSFGADNAVFNVSPDGGVSGGGGIAGSGSGGGGHEGAGGGTEDIPSAKDDFSSSAGKVSKTATPQRALRHIVSVGVRMAIYRIIFGLVKQLLLKGSIVKGLSKMLTSCEGELVSFNPLRWAIFGSSMACYRPLQVLLESLLTSIYQKMMSWYKQQMNNRKKNNNNNNNNNNSQEEEDQNDEGEDDEQEDFEDGDERQSLLCPERLKKKKNNNQDCSSRVIIIKILSSALSGALVSLPVLKVFNINTRIELCLYVSVRAAYAVGSGLIFPYLLPKIVREGVPLQFWNSLAMTAASTMILGCCTYHPETHSREYANFLVGATTFDKAQMQSLADGYFRTMSPHVADSAAKKGLQVYQDVVVNKLKTDELTGRKIMPMKSICRMIHPQTKWCWLAFLQHCTKQLLTVSLPLYGPLKIITTVAKSPSRIAKQPVESFKHIFKSVMQSSLFLTLYVCGAYRASCFLHNFDIHSPALNSVLCGIVAGLALMLEPIDRQIDLVLFCCMHALRCSVLLLNKFSYISRPTKKTVAFWHTVAWAVMFVVYELRRDAMRSGLFGSMVTWFVGDGKEKKKYTNNNVSKEEAIKVEEKE